MERYSYFLCFPEGDSQEIFHPLRFGDIVDVNGNIFRADDLDPKKITYKVTGIKEEVSFKDVAKFYKLDLMTSIEVIEEKDFGEIIGKKDKMHQKLGKIFTKLEKKLAKKKKDAGY